MRVFDHDLSEKILVYKTPPTWISVVRLGKFFGIILPVDETDSAGKKKSSWGFIGKKKQQRSKSGDSRNFAPARAPAIFSLNVNHCRQSQRWNSQET